MHELSITQSIVDIACEHARQAGVQQVLAVTVEIGALAGVVPEAVSFCYESVTQGTLLEGVPLRIDWLEARGRCGACGHEQTIDNYFEICEKCGGIALDVFQGEELRIKELEVE